MMMGELYTEVSVVFENVRFQRATNIPKDGNLEFIIMIQKGSGNFEVSSNEAVVIQKCVSLLDYYFDVSNIIVIN